MSFTKKLSRVKLSIIMGLIFWQIFFNCIIIVLVFLCIFWKIIIIILFILIIIIIAHKPHIAIVMKHDLQEHYNLDNNIIIIVIVIIF